MADLIVTNARVLTMDPRRPRAEAVAIASGRVLAVGTRAEVAALAAPGAEEVDARGNTVLPGFVESHMHLFPGGAELDHLQLLGVSGAEALGRALAAYLAGRPGGASGGAAGGASGGGLVMAQGADYGFFGDRATTRADLDALMPDRPFAMMAADHHTLWANTAALRAAGGVALHRAGQRLGPVHAGQLQVVQLCAAGEQMHVALDEAGKDGGAGGVDLLYPRGGQRGEIGAAAHRKHPIAGDGQRLGPGAARVHGQDPGVDDQRMGLGRGGHGGAPVGLAAAPSPAAGGGTSPGAGLRRSGPRGS